MARWHRKFLTSSSSRLGSLSRLDIVMTTARPRVAGRDGGAAEKPIAAKPNMIAVALGIRSPVMTYFS